MSADAPPAIPGLIDAMTQRLRDGFPSVSATLIDRYVYEARTFTTTYMLDAVAYVAIVERIVRAVLEAHVGEQPTT
jgi:hypothetical protein